MLSKFSSFLLPFNSSSNAKRALTFPDDDDNNEQNKADSTTTDSKRQKIR
jgi:hypothetical protein